MKCSDSLSSVLAAPRVANQYRSCARCSLPRAASASAPGPGGFGSGPSWAAFFQIERRRRASQVPGEPHVCMPCSPTPAGSLRQAIAAHRYGLPPFGQRRLPRCRTYEAQWHGLHTPCVRFAAWVTPAPRNTRFRLLASFTGQGWLPAGFQCKVSSVSPSHPPCPGLSWRTEKSAYPWLRASRAPKLPHRAKALLLPSRAMTTQFLILLVSGWVNRRQQDASCRTQCWDRVDPGGATLECLVL